MPTLLPSGPQVPWRMKIGEGLASPVVAGGKVFYCDNTGGKETLHCIDATTATEHWRAAIDDPFSDLQGPTGPRCTPMVEGDRVYAVSCKGELHCRRAADGQLLWRTNYTNDFGAIFIGEKGSAPGAVRHGNNGTPGIDGEHLVAGVGGTNGAGVVCFDKRTGAVIWKSQNDQPPRAPVVATLAGSTSRSFHLDGAIGQRRDNGEATGACRLRISSRGTASPIIHETRGLVAPGRAVRHEGHTDGSGSKAERAWLSKEAALNFASPVALGNHLYGLGPAKNIVCVELSSGKLLWSKDGYFTTSADKAHAAFVVMDKNILMLTDGGELVLFAADPNAFKEISRAQVCGLNWCNPAYADGRLYLRDGIKGAGDLLCLKLLD